MADFDPMLTVPEQIARMKEKGITFELCSEEDAATYLEENNNYFKVSAYRHNYDRRTDGTYINLDFAYLRDLAIIDMKLRYVCIQLALDVEHYAKMEILRCCVIHKEDGYAICLDFINQLDDRQRDKLSGEIGRNRNSPYYRDVIRKYGDGVLPVWVFLEMIPFGRLISFYTFCAKRYDDSRMKERSFVLRTCGKIRNASAHNSCVLNDLRPSRSSRYPCYSVQDALSGIPGLSDSLRRRKMRNDRLQQIATLFYAHTAFVTSVGVRKKATDLLRDLSSRMDRNSSFYAKNDLIRSSFDFLKIIISSWFMQKN